MAEDKRSKQILEGREPWWYWSWPAVIPLIPVVLIVVIYWWEHKNG